MVVAPPQIGHPIDPRAEYDTRLNAASGDRDRLLRLERSLRIAQGVAVLLTVVPGVFALAYIHFAWLGIPIISFLFLMHWQHRVRMTLKRVGQLIDYYRRGLERLNGRWSGAGDSGLGLAPPEHPYAFDLDIFGAGSLFERLSTARTHAGAQTLASWLLASASPEEIRARQEAIDDLRGRLELREDLYVRACEVPTGIDLEGLIRWGVDPPLLPGRARALAVYAFMMLAALALAGWQSGPLFQVVGRVLLVGHVLFGAFFLKRVSRVVAPLKRRSQELAVWQGLLERIEAEPFQAAALRRVQDSLRVAGMPPSHCVKRLTRLAGKLRLMEVPEWRWLGWLELRTTRVAFALEEWRRTHGTYIARWVDAVASFEALSSLAAYAYENPADPFPELTGSSARFDAESLGHPLLPPQQCVANDLCLGGERQAFIVTGSNMSGKSTLLRAVGVNAVLALAGGPVRARRISMSPLAIAASLRMQDSLQAGESRFFAEIRRLRQMVDLAQRRLPLLFLIDEIMQGTNPADRKQGAEAVIRGLLDLRAIGLVTTHDLPLTAMAERSASRLENVHFADDGMEDGQLHFDFRLRPGIVKQSNALALMRLIGLPDGAVNG